MLKKIKFFSPFLITILVIFLFYFKRLVFFKFYPPFCNFFFFIVFFTSLFTKETAIQKIAKKIEGNLSDNLKNYTRKLTYVWCCFTFINFIISLLSCFISDKIWLLYNGFISYALMATLFLGELIYRKILKSKGKL